MLMGFPPFQSTSRNQKLLFDSISKGSFKLPAKMDESAKDLIKLLLVNNVV